MLNWVIYRPSKILNLQSEAKVVQVIAIVITRSVVCLFVLLKKRIQFKLKLMIIIFCSPLFSLPMHTSETEEQETKYKW